MYDIGSGGCDIDGVRFLVCGEAVEEGVELVETREAVEESGI